MITFKFEFEPQHPLHVDRKPKDVSSKGSQKDATLFVPELGHCRALVKKTLLLCGLNRHAFHKSNSVNVREYDADYLRVDIFYDCKTII
mmetsp:Transcript_18044/g.27917  ORF Transcript_18044/g.27917 Transcript_18044/m.27917 type:complete len:89 (+) Transcript_18044:1207-1473(+)